MKNGTIFIVVFLVGFFATGGSYAAKLHNPWAEVDGPLAGAAKPIGGYAAGCVQGAVSILPDEGADFQVMRKSRERFYTHPDMRDFIKGLAAEIQAKNYGTLLVGDLGQARGGPTTTGHSSHQSGLDGDFWFWLDSPADQRKLTAKEVENLSAISMLNAKHSGVHATRFQDKHVKVLEYAAKQPEVARIFVHPRIKQEVCKRTDQADWLSKLRPWWGHHYHFHVRLDCPPGASECKPQAAPAANHGCGGELTWWFSAEALAKAGKKGPKLTAQQRLDRKLAKVPSECAPLLK